MSAHFLEAAQRIGRRLCRDALWSGYVCNWLGWQARTLGGKVTIGRGSQNASLGYGTAGIGLFLARLHTVTSDPLVKTTARAALRHAANHAQEAGAGFFTGSIGIAYALAEADGLLGSDEFSEAACGLLRQVAEGVSSPGQYAGAISPLLVLGKCSRFTCAADVAVRLGEHLAGAVSSPAGQGQIKIGQAEAAYANAFLDLAAVTGEAKYKHAASRMVQTVSERATAKLHWPSEDFAAFPELYAHSELPLSFLHAQSVRLVARPEGADRIPHVDRMIDATVASLMRPLVLGDGGYCLGHGVAAKGEVLVLAAAMLDRPELLNTGVAACQTGITHFSDRDAPWPCAVPAPGESPDLLFGLAGIGYFCLRLHAVSDVPSLLVSQTAMACERGA